jgi:hypothetical protein
MVKKLLLLLIAIAALAAPAAAHATELTAQGEETPVDVGATLTATSGNLETTIGAGTISCANVTIHGELVENGPGVKIAPYLVTTKTCAYTISKIPVTITEPKVGLISLKEFKGDATLTYKYDASGIENCRFSGTLAFTYISEVDSLAIPGSALTGSSTDPAQCANAGTIHGSFTLETSNGIAVNINS